MTLNKNFKRALVVCLGLPAVLSWFFVGRSALAQPDPPRMLARAAGVAGIFCGYFPSESGDSAGGISIQTNTDSYYLNLDTVGSQEEFDRITGVPVGTPVAHGFQVTEYHNEFADERLTWVFVDNVEPFGPAHPSLCRPEAE
ncbi:MAG: hypothetical protein LBO05_05655 [Deltaproteobacteria bacterium]|nr:hypothetical protein [Deltaproteobacteria bacterium]